ncbi:RNA-binding domain-containing protein [Hymenopellis radicata]|nr:RNA-binding domain-containing protein [Hymenopellis radicata]
MSFDSRAQGAKDAPTPRPNKRRRTEVPDGKSKKDDKVGKQDGKSGKDSKLEQYMDVMQTKTTKGPSWANEPQAEASTSKQTLDVDMTPPEDDEPANQAGMSDLDWMRRHMSKKVDEAEAKVFEQSDDEDDEGSLKSDAVASSIADRMNIPKSDILNPEGGSDNAAVKLALAETHIIQETKTYLESQGVVLSAFSSTARSDTTILPHGTLTRVIVPPAGTMAVVDFDRPADASTAFRAVAYRRLGSSVIYLEKGPLGVFTDTPPPAPQVHVSSTHAITIPEQAAGAAADEEPSLSAGSTLFVKNLAFATTAERLTQIFRSLPSFAFARVQTKPDPKRPDARLSMGYGFVGFKDVEGAKKAMKSMQGFNLDGHALHIKFAGRGTESDKPVDPAVSKSRTTKMLVKNVPFEATKKDIRELFGAHGQLKSVRLPRKFDSRTRGFAFLDFVSRTEAENAYAALRHTHLLGRHLVLEWAEEGEQDLDVLRKKAGVGFGDGKIMPGRKRKLDMDGGDPVDDEDRVVSLL